MSGFKPELPPRLSFDNDIAEAQRRGFEFVCSQLKECEDRLREEFDEPEAFGLFYGDPSKANVSRRISVPFVAVDQVAFESVMTKTDRSLRRIALSLFRDGSPCVPEEFGSDKNNFYIIAGLDMPPTMFHDSGLGLWLDTGNPEICVAGMVAWMRNNLGPGATYELTDEDCSSIVGGLEAAETDIDIGTMRVVYGI